MSTASRAGFSLLEPLVALVILGLAGTAWVTLLAETRAAGAATDRVEARTREAATIVAGVAREPRRSLVARVGRRRIGTHELRVSRWDRALFAIEVADPASGAPVLSTVVYRPGEGDDAR